MGKNIFQSLVKDADAVLESFRPGVMKRLGLDYEVLKEINPHLVYCAITGFGSEGIRSQKAGHDLLKKEILSGYSAKTQDKNYPYDKKK